jgi:peptide/nickel transport system substrate-binding protein
MSFKRFFTKKRVVSIAATLLASTFVLAACGDGGGTAATNGGGGNQAGGTPSNRDTLTIVTSNLGVSMDPAGSNDNASAQVTRQIFDTLVLADYDTFDPIPALATSWEVIDASSIRFELRQGVYFHDGSPLTVEDVAFSLVRAGQSLQMAAVTGMISHVDIHGPYSFTVHTDIPFAPLMRHLAHPGASIISRAHTEMVEARGDSIADFPMGTGAFMYHQLHLGDRLELRRNDNYWGELARVREITMRLVPDASTRLVEIETGGADLAFAIAPPDVPRAVASNDVILHRTMSLGTDYIGFNTASAPFDNPNVRLAIAYALDLNIFYSVIWSGAGAPANGPLADAVIGATATRPFERNLDRARELLAQEGLADGFDAEIWWNLPNMQRSDIAEIVANQLRDLNINITIQSLEWAVILERTEDPEPWGPFMFILGWTSVTGDADYGLHPLFHSDNFGPGNRTRFSHPEVDRLLDLGRSETNEAARLEIYRQVQEILREYVPTLTLRQGEWLDASVPSLRGFRQSPAGHYNFATLYFVD